MDTKQLKNSKQLKQMFELYKDELYEKAEINKELTREMIKQEEVFFEKLTEEQKEEFEQLMRIKNKVEDETSRSIFIFTYKLAVRLFIESII